MFKFTILRYNVSVQLLLIRREYIMAHISFDSSNLTKFVNDNDASIETIVVLNDLLQLFYWG